MRKYFICLYLIVLLFPAQNLFAENERKTKAIIATRVEPFFLAGLNLEAGVITKNKIYITGEYGAGGIIPFYGLKWGGGVNAGRYFDFPNSRAKFAPGIGVGKWVYIWDLCTGDCAPNGSYSFGNTFIKYLFSSKKTHFNISAAAMFGYTEYSNSYSYCPKQGRYFVVFPQLQIGTAWVF